MREGEDLFLRQTRQLVTDWYRKLDIHAPASEVVALLAAEGLEFRLPEGTIQGREGFIKWYEGVIRLFFDETHSLQELNVVAVRRRRGGDLGGALAGPALEAPRRSKRMARLRRHPTLVRHAVAGDGRPVIRTYVVELLVPREGSATL